MVFFINVLRCGQGEFLKQLRPLLVYDHFHNPCDLNNPLTPMILLVILLTVCHTVLVMLVWRIWYWINL